MDETIEVAAWADLQELPAAMDAYAAQFREIVRHAVAWLCRPDGFAPSPACVLRPLAEAMERDRLDLLLDLPGLLPGAA